MLIPENLAKTEKGPFKNASLSQIFITSVSTQELWSNSSSSKYNENKLEKSSIFCNLQPIQLS